MATEQAITDQGAQDSTPAKHFRMPKHLRDMPPRRRHIVLFVFLALVALLVTCCVGFIKFSLAERSAVLNEVPEIGEPVDIEDTSGATGRFNVHAEYNSILTDHLVTTDFVWDDSWFFQDNATYNEELATACCVLSQVANSEGFYYFDPTSHPKYMENLLAQMGFEDCDTSSYRYNSTVLDEILNIFENKTNVCAYTIASKHITDSSTGHERLLVMVAVRGTWGTEWISNFNATMSAGFIEGSVEGAGDYSGFSEAATAIINNVIDYIHEVDGGTNTKDVSLLLTGHSRGGATSNLAAAYADSMAENAANIDKQSANEGIPTDLAGIYPYAENTYCYTFATPRNTTVDNCHSEKFDNIFNVLNPSDPVARLPLSEWGFDRYGTDYFLPEPGTDGFDELYAKVVAQFETNDKCAIESDPNDAALLDQICEVTLEQSPTTEDFMSVPGMVKFIYTFANKADIVRVLKSHAPDTYIAWLQTIDQTALRTSR